MSSSLLQGTSPPPPLATSSTSAPSNSRKVVTEKKRRLSMAEQLVKVRRMENTSIGDHEPTHDQDNQNIEATIHTLRTQRLGEYKQPVYIPPMAKPNLQASDGTLFPLMKAAKDFIAGDCQVMLILGDSGAGKSTFNQHMENELWQGYKAGGRIPLFINLPALERPEKELIAEQLRAHRFSQTQIQELEQHRQFLLICDGYDESQLSCNLHTTNLLNRYGQRDTKLLITCRSQYLGPDYRLRFEPKATDEYHRAATDYFMEAVIAPFSKEQIEDYVERYVPLKPRTWAKGDYMDKLMAIPNLMDLVKNPFLLTLCLEALPNVVEDKSDLWKLRVTRVQLYDTFVQHWLEVNKRRLQDHRLDRDNQMAFEGLLEDGFESNGIRFQQDLAAAIFREQKGRPIVSYTQRRDGASWKASFFSSDADITMLRGASLLSRIGIQHHFVHRSILEYFYSCSIYGPTHNNEEFDPHPHSICSDISDHPLSQRNLIVEPSIIQFLAERVQIDSRFKQQLLTFIEQSKIGDDAARAAANAITILVKAGVSFIGSDLRGIRVPGADLSGGQFDSAQLQGADLTKVNLTRSWIRQADLSEARMEGVQFGELPYLEEIESVISIVYSTDGKFLAVGLGDGDINIYDTATWTKTHTLHGHNDEVVSVAYSSSSEQLLSGSSDHTVRLWDCQTGLTDYILEGHILCVNAVAFSPADDQIASASDDETVRLWDPRTGATLFVLQGHTDRVKGVAYSPDGRNIVSESDETIRIFDTCSGQMGLDLENEFGSGACSPDGRWFVSRAGEGHLQLWDLTIGEPVKHWKCHSADIIDFSPNNKWIASLTVDYTVKLWDAHSDTLLSVFAGHRDDVECVVFSPNGMQLASGSYDETVRLWDLTTIGTGFVQGGGSADPIVSIAYSPDGKTVISGDSSGTMRLYDTATGDPDLSIPCGTAQVGSVTFSPDGLWIATGGSDGGIRIWSAETDVTNVLRGHTEGIITLAFSPDSQWIASGSNDRSVRLWDARLRTPGLVLHGHEVAVLSVAFSPCGQQVISGSMDGTVRAWDRSTGDTRVIVAVDDLVRAITVQYSSNGVQIALVRQRGNCLEIWDEFRKIASLPLQYAHSIGSIAFSLCGHWIALGCADSLMFWNWRDAAQGWECKLRMDDFYGGVWGLAWRPGTLEFVTGTGVGSVQTWRLFEASCGRWDVQLLWSSGHAGFVATHVVIDDTIGLSVTNLRLLKQRRAREWPMYIDSSDEGQDDGSDQSQDKNMVDDQNDNMDEGKDKIQDEIDAE